VKSSFALAAGVFAAAMSCGGIERIALESDFSQACGWSLDCYKERISGTFGGELGGRRGLLLSAAIDGPCDTQWLLTSPRTSVAAGERSYRFSFEVVSERMMLCGFTKSFMDWNRRRCLVSFYAGERLVSDEEFTFVISGGRSRLEYEGAIPPGADSLAVQLGVNHPNFNPGERFLVGDFRLSLSESASELSRVGLKKLTRLPFDVPCVTLRDDGMVLRDGEPYFPIGLYGMRTNVFNSFDFDIALEQLKTNGFNMVQSYQERHNPAFLAALERQGLTTFLHVESVPYKTFGSPESNFWKEARSPAVLSWYVGDDTMRHDSPDELVARYASVRAADPRRLVAHAERYDGTGSGMSALGLYASAQDVFQPEIYPIVEGTEEQVSNCVARVVLEMRGSWESLRRGDPGRPKSVWPILQCFSGRHYRRQPTFEEERAMTFAAVAERANGLLWYTYSSVTSTPELWRNMTTISRQVAELAPVLVEETPRQPSAPVIVSGPENGPLGQPTIVYLYKAHGGKGYLLTVNTTKNEVSARFALADGRKTASVLWENRALTVEDGCLADRWSPFAVHCYELDGVSDAGAQDATRAIQASALELDVVVNGDFEGGMDEKGQAFGWRKPFPKNFRVEKNAGENGSTGLVYRNDDPKFYAFPQQEIRLLPGATYEIRARYMTEKLHSPSGASGFVGLCVECKDANGKFTKGVYQSGFGPTDGKWKDLYQIGTIPTNAMTMTLSPLVLPGFVGVVHFDSIEVLRVVCQPVIGLYTSAYREQVAEDFDLVAGLDIKAAQISKDDYEPVFTLPLASGGTTNVVATDYTERQARIRVDVRTLPRSKSTVAFALRDKKTGAVRAEDRATRVVERLDKLPERRVSVDRLNRLIVDGKPFFPLGLFWSEATMKEKDLEEYARSPFNCLLNYHQPNTKAMDDCQRHGLKVIYPIEGVWGPGCRFTNEESIVSWTRNSVLRHKDHPALLAWYMNDERGKTYVPQLAKRQALVRELDPEHPTYTVLYQLQILDKYMDTYDIIGTDPYPVGSDDDYEKCSQWAEAAVCGSFGVRPVWQVPQVFDWGAYWKNKADKTRMPTVREMKNMFWQAVASGANGLVGYSHFDLRKMDGKTPRAKAWADVCEAAEEIRRYVPVILSGDTPPTVTSDNAAVRVRAWRDGETVHVLAVNAKDAPEKVTVTVGDGTTLAAALPPLGMQTW